MYNFWQIRRIIKRDSRAAVLRNWLPLLTLSCLHGLISLPFTYLLLVRGQIVSATGLFLFFGELLLMAPLSLGQRRCYLRALRHQPVRVSEAFSYYRGKEPYVSSLALVGFFSIITFILTLFCSYMVTMILILLSGYVHFFLNLDVFAYLVQWNLLAQALRRLQPDVLLFLLFISLTGFVVVMLVQLWVKVFLARYLCAYNLMLDRPGMRLSVAFEQSRSIMRGHTEDMFWLYISFIPWILLVPLTAGLVMVFLVPYLQTCEILYLEYFRDCYHRAGNCL